MCSEKLYIIDRIDGVNTKNYICRISESKNPAIKWICLSLDVHKLSCDATISGRVSSMMVQQQMKRTWSCLCFKNIEPLLLENQIFLFSARGFYSTFGFWKIERFQFCTWFLFEFWVSLLVACHYVRNATISFDLFFWRLWTFHLEHAPNFAFRIMEHAPQCAGIR